MRDPWRYRCPECESTQIYWRHTKKHYWCDYCSATFENRYDAKKEKVEY